jgi:transketolase
MAIEDISQATSFPGMTVIVPADGPSTKAATRAMLEREGPTYMRCGRPAVPLIYSDEGDFLLGKATRLRDGDDVTIIANGIMVAMALDAAEGLRSDGVEARVLDMHTVKPLDVDAIVAAANETRGIVVAEEHLCYGGLGSAVSMVVSEQRPSKMAFVNIGDTYATSGKPDELLAQFGLTPGAIEDAAHRVLKD